MFCEKQRQQLHIYRSLRKEIFLLWSRIRCQCLASVWRFGWCFWNTFTVGFEWMLLRWLLRASNIARHTMGTPMEVCNAISTYMLPLQLNNVNSNCSLKLGLGFHQSRGYLNERKTSIIQTTAAMPQLIRAWFIKQMSPSSSSAIRALEKNCCHESYISTTVSFTGQLTAAECSRMLYLLEIELMATEGTKDQWLLCTITPIKHVLG